MIGAVSLSALALGMLASIDAGAATGATEGIASTRHNLGSSNRDANGLTDPQGGGMLARDGDLYTTATDEICVFCHTPHAAQATSTFNMPLWNKGVTTATYTVYTSGSMQGSAAMGGGGQPSLACLSCHDGTQAMDNMINAPTSPNVGNGYTAGGARLSTIAFSLTADAINGIMTTTAGIVMLGTDLSNDHPIGMAYCGGGQSATGSNAGCADSDFIASAGSGIKWYVGGSSTERENMRIYGTDSSTATVECGSCHDPHNAVNKVFLRTSNEGSAVCLTCHVK
jgi:predicted CXXCH cytochrome family protein